MRIHSIYFYIWYHSITGKRQWERGRGGVANLQQGLCFFDPRKQGKQNLSIYQCPCLWQDWHQRPLRIWINKFKNFNGWTSKRSARSNVSRKKSNQRRETYWANTVRRSPSVRSKGMPPTNIYAESLYLACHEASSDIPSDASVEFIFWMRFTKVRGFISSVSLQGLQSLHFFLPYYFHDIQLIQKSTLTEKEEKKNPKAKDFPPLSFSSAWQMIQCPRKWNKLYYDM